MSFFDLADMTVAYVQYIYLLVSISPGSFPPFFVEPFVSLRFLAFDVLNHLSEGDRYSNPLTITLPKWIPLDSRLSFVLVVVVVPLLISLFGSLIAFKGVTFVWLLLMNASLFTMLFGSLLLAIPWIYPKVLLAQRTRVLLTVVGTVMCVLLITTGIVGVWIWRSRRKKREKEIIIASLDNQQEIEGLSLAEKAVTRTEMNCRALAALKAYEKEKERYLAKRSITGSISLFVLTFACVIGASISLGFPSFETVMFYQESVVGRGVGIFLLICAALSSIWFVLGSFKRGRKIQTTLYNQFGEPLLMLALILVSFIYSPVLLHMINVLWCTLIVCESGERLTVSGSLAHSVERNSIWESPEDVCTPCIFNATQQNCPLSLQNELCLSPTKQSRLAYDRNVPCSNIDIFYKIAIGIMLASYTFAYPIFLALVAHQATKILEDEFPLEKRICDEFTEKELYYEKVQKSKNISAGIYEVFKHRYRMARVTLLLERVLFTIITALTRRGLDENLSWLGIALILVVAFIYLAYTSILRPFARPVENIYNTTQQLTFVIVGSLGLVGNIRGRDSIPFGVSVFVAVFIFVAPVIALVVGFGFTFRIVRKRAKRLQRRLQRGIAIVQKEGNRSEVVCLLRRVSVVSSKQHRNDTETLDKSVNNSRSPFVNDNRSCSEMKSVSSERKEVEKPHDNVMLAERHSSKSVASEPNTEREPLDVVTVGERKSIHGGVAPNETLREKETTREDVSRGQQNFNIHNPSNETAEYDDYFGDKRVFIPAEYFKGYKEVPVELTEGAEEAQQHKAESGAPSAQTLFKTARQSILAFLRLDGSHSLTTHREDKLAATRRASLSSLTRRDVSTEGNEENKVNLRFSAAKPKTFAAWLRCWQRVFTLNGDRLRYKDVLHRRKKLQMSTGVSQRPFWIEPTEGQRQKIKSAGCMTPSFRALNVSKVDKSTFDAMLFTQICEHKRRGTLSQIGAGKRAEDEPKGDIPVSNPFEQTFMKCTYDGDNCILWDCIKGSSLNSDTLEGLCNTGSSTTERNGPKSILVDKTLNKSPIHSIAESALVSIINGSDVPPLPSARENAGNAGIPDTVNLPAQLSLLSKSQTKLDELKKRCPRTIVNQSRLGGCRSSLYAKVISNIHIDNKEINDWEAFLGQLLNDVHIPFKNENDAQTDRVAEQEVGNSSEGEQQGRQKESEGDDEKGKQSEQAQQKESERADEKGKQSEQAQSPYVPVFPDEEQMFQLCRHELLRKRLLAAFKQQREKLADLQRAVDYRIALTVKKYMQALFMGLSLFAACALVICVCGMLNSRDKSFVDGVHQDDSVSYQLMGYNSWAEFTLNCCCSPLANNTAMYPYYALDTELWMCADGRSKERVRRDAYKSRVVSGYAVRGLCEMSFKNSCRVEVSGNGYVQLTGCVGVSLDEQARW